MTFMERRFAEQARISVASAEALLPRANAREQALVMAARRLVDGDWDGACAALDRVLVDHPRDAFAVQSAHLLDFYRGDALNLRNRISRVLPSWGPSVPGYSYILGMHAFGLEECNQYPEAEESGRRALELQPKPSTTGGYIPSRPTSPCSCWTRQPCSGGCSWKAWSSVAGPRSWPQTGPADSRPSAAFTPSTTCTP